MVMCIHNFSAARPDFGNNVMSATVDVVMNRRQLHCISVFVALWLCLFVPYTKYKQPAARGVGQNHNHPVLSVENTTTGLAHAYIVSIHCRGPMLDSKGDEAQARRESGQRNLPLMRNR